jgi:RNA polymerase sigma-70 factor, ECF subfamily
MNEPAPLPIPLRATDPDEWSALMARAQIGDAAAYRLLLVGIAPYLRSIARRTLRNPGDAEDAVQDILLTLHSIRHAYDPSRPFKPWLSGVAQHRLMDRLRVRGRLAAREVAFEPEHETFVAVETNNKHGLDRHTLHAGLQSLPQGQRQAITLLKLQELSLKEASDQTGMSIAALKVATHRGLKTLRRLLGDGEHA